MRENLCERILCELADSELGGIDAAGTESRRGGAIYLEVIRFRVL